MATWNRVLRIIFGLAALASPLAWYGIDAVSSWGFLGLIPLVSGIAGICPITNALRRTPA